MTNLTKIFVIFFTVFTHFLYSQSKPTVSLTFDDGMLANRPCYKFEEWNSMLLNKLKANKVKAAFFIAGNRKDNERGQILLNSWDNDGHLMANHTWNHPNYNSSETSIELFKNEILKTDALISQFENYTRLFRFPYLKEGNTKQKVQAIRNFLDSLDYRIGYVTIDASDWYIDSRLVKKLSENPNADLDPYRKYYLDHIWDRVQFYEKMAYELEGRHIKHNLLLHHNLLSALFIDDLIKIFREKGWNVISAEEAFIDPVYSKCPEFAGESLIYAMAKDSGNYEDILRYPAEDSRYMEDEMDELGL